MTNGQSRMVWYYEEILRGGFSDTNSLIRGTNDSKCVDLKLNRIEDVEGTAVRGQVRLLFPVLIVTAYLEGEREREREGRKTAVQHFYLTWAKNVCWWHWHSPCKVRGNTRRRPLLLSKWADGYSRCMSSLFVTIVHPMIMWDRKHQKGR